MLIAASMLKSTAVVIALQCLLLAQALLSCLSVAPPMGLLAGIGISGIGAILATSCIASGRTRGGLLGWYLFIAGGVLIPAGVAAQPDSFSVWHVEYSITGWLLVGVFWLTTLRIETTAWKWRWRMVTILCAHAANLVWIGVAYVKNDRLAFYLALIPWLALWIATKRSFARRTFVIQLANSMILLIVAVPLFSFVYSPAEALNVPPNLRERPYRYEAARKDPAAYARWFRHYHEEWLQFLTAIMRPHIFLPRPHAQAAFFESQVSINSHGFRGREIPAAKESAYRIVALGESTTFGVTMEKDDKPWPELLEQMIRDRIQPGRPVHIINAGVPSRNLKENLERLPEILALQPDMIISYHGFNGFHFIYDGMPPIRGVAVPRYKPRPIKLLADVEHRRAIEAYRKRYEKNLDPEWGTVERPLATEYARLYRDLITAAATNRIPLVLATYSMAVNEGSSKDLKEFYRATALQLGWQVRANTMHNVIVQELAERHPEIVFIDTRPHFDGQHENFIDLMHFTQPAREKMAEIMFSAIGSTLRTAFSQDPMGSHLNF